MSIVHFNCAVTANVACHCSIEMNDILSSQYTADLASCDVAHHTASASRS